MTEAMSTTEDAPLAPLRHGKFLFHKHGLEIDPSKPEPTFEEWSEVGHILSLFEETGLPFALGDWLNYGEGKFSELAAQVIDARHFTESTCKVYRWVAASVPPNNRIPTLGFKHHMLVAGLGVLEQHTWLVQARDKRWTAADLANALRAGGDDAVVKTLWLVVRCADRADLEALQVELEGKGRVCKAKEDRKKLKGAPKKKLTAKPKAAKKRRGRSKG